MIFEAVVIVGLINGDRLIDYGVDDVFSTKRECEAYFEKTKKAKLEGYVAQFADIFTVQFLCSESKGALA